MLSNKYIINKYLPNFIYHSDEKYKSCKFSTYKDKCSELIPHHLYLSKNNFDIKYGVDNEFQIVSNVFEKSINNIKVTDVIYAIFFPYNGNIGIVNKGEHWIDIEYITLRFYGSKQDIMNISNILPDYVFFSEHKRGTWKKYKNLISTDPEHINVFIAKSSHALYWKPSTFYRYFGFGNDKCNNGIKIPLENIDICVYDPQNVDSLFEYDTLSQFSYINFKEKHCIFHGCDVHYSCLKSCNICFN